MEIGSLIAGNDFAEPLLLIAKQTVSQLYGYVAGLRVRYAIGGNDLTLGPALYLRIVVCRDFGVAIFLDWTFPIDRKQNVGTAIGQLDFMHFDGPRGADWMKGIKELLRMIFEALCDGPFDSALARIATCEAQAEYQREHQSGVNPRGHGKKSE